MGDNMDYNEFLNNVYSQFKNNDQYTSNNYIKFLRENNTNIVNFLVDDINFGLIQGTIIDQANSILIYFHVKSEIILSKANINDDIVYITNVLLAKGNIKITEMVKRKFKERKDLYKPNAYDEFIDNTELNSEFTYLISNIMEKYNQKNTQKRHKI